LVGNLAGAEALQARGARDFLQALAHHAVEALGRQADRHAAFERGGVLEGNLHFVLLRHSRLLRALQK
jgi:hypothetical protein